MCGFAGSIGFIPSEENIEKCMQGLNKRGPDDYGKYSDDQLTLLHTRLSIIDPTDNAKQPMVHKGTGVVVAFNGEIYNFREIRDKFDLDIKNNSDTKVILDMYIKFGLNFVSELNGMFAICIWDPRDKSLHLIRDRFGIKPLYIYQENQKFIFGSDLNVIFDLGARKIPNLITIKKYLKFGINENNKDTFYENIYAIEPSSIFSLKSNKSYLKKYWILKDQIDENKFVDYNKDDLNNLIKNNLQDSINSHMLSDVPIGVALSSGLDSNIILDYVLKNKKITNLKTFTYGFNENAYDEIDINSKINNDDIILNYNSKLQSHSLISELSQAVKYFQSPVGGLGTLSLFHLMKSVKKNNINVILSGEGADEVFAGYRYYFYAFLLDLKYKKDLERLNNEVKSWKILTGEDLTNVVKNNNLLSNKAFGMKAPDGSNMTNVSLEGELLKNLDIDEELIMNCNKDNNLKDIRCEDIFSKKLPKLLMFQDRCSMYSGVESRVPFLDHKLVENIFSLNPAHLIQNGELKHLLRLNYKKLNNKKFLNNQKQFVATPQREWIKYDLYKQISSEILDSKLQEKGLINLNQFKKDYEEYSLSPNLGNSFFVWKVLNIKYLFDN